MKGGWSTLVPSVWGNTVTPLLSPSSQQVGAPVPLLPTRTLDHEGVKQGYTSPGGLFFPPVAVEEQRRHYQSPQQIIQKPRSQAIPIVPPKVCMVA